MPTVRREGVPAVPTPSSASSVRAVALRNGRWAFVLVYRGVTYPAQGAFGSALQAQAAGAAALKALESRG